MEKIESPTVSLRLKPIERAALKYLARARGVNQREVIRQLLSDALAKESKESPRQEAAQVPHAS